MSTFHQRQAQSLLNTEILKRKKIGKNALTFSARKGEENESPPTLLSDFNNQQKDGAHLLQCRNSAPSGSREVSSRICKYQEKLGHKGTSPALPQVSCIRPGLQPLAQQRQPLEAENPLCSRDTTLHVLGSTTRAVKL